jgi:hypothetical protein
MNKFKYSLHPKIQAIQYSNGHFLETIGVWFSNGLYKMAAKTIEKPDYLTKGHF